MLPITSDPPVKMLNITELFNNSRNTSAPDEMFNHQLIWSQIPQCSVIVLRERVDQQVETTSHLKMPVSVQQGVWASS